MVMYMFFSLIATFKTEGLIFMGIYLYETEIIAGEYKKVWGASGQGKMSFGTFTMSQSIALDAWVIAIFTILLLIIYFILISNKFVTYVREIISGVERMKSGDLMEEIPVRGEDEFSEIAASINEMRHNLYETMEAQKAVEKTKDELITNVAHDLRTPLTSILGYLDLLTQGDFLTEEQKQKYLGIVSSKAKQLETLVKDLFDYTRYEAEDADDVNEYSALNVEPTARPLVINVDYNEATFQITKDIRAVQNGTDKKENLWGLEKSYYDACENYLHGKTSTPEDWAAYKSRISAVGLLIDGGYQSQEQKYLDDTDGELPKSLQQLEKDSFIQIIMGVKPVSYFDTFVKEWYEQGGEELTEQIRRSNPGE